MTTGGWIQLTGVLKLNKSSIHVVRVTGKALAVALCFRSLITLRSCLLFSLLRVALSG